MRNNLGKSAAIIDLLCLLPHSACDRGPLFAHHFRTQALPGPANRLSWPQIEPLAPVVDREAVALFEVVRHTVGLDLDAEKLTAHSQVEA